MKMDCCNTKNDKGCCDDLEKNKMNREKKMDRKLWLWILIAALFLAVVYVTFQGESSVTAQAGSAAKAAASSYGGMVGGC